MSLPPTVIAIKRKRGDEPLDVLVVQTEDSGPNIKAGKRRQTDGLYKFVRLQDENGSGEGSAFTSSQRAASACQVQNATKPVADLSQPHDRTTESLSVPAAATSIPSISTPHSPCTSTIADPSKRSASSRPTRGLRRFLLTKERFTDAPSGRSSPQHGIQKRRGTARQGMAVFSEQKLSRLRSMANMRQLVNPQAETGQRVLRESASQNFKRPSATLQERKWRNDNWQSRGPRSDRSVSPLPGFKNEAERKSGSMPETDTESLELAASLQQFAFEATASQELVPPSIQQSSRLPLPGEPPKSADHIPNSKPDDIDHADSSDWVYDRYVRHAAGMELDDSTTPMELEDDLAQSGNLPAGGGNAYGLLVIRDQDKEDWEAFAADEAEDDEDGYTEDEDSNAEDFYANDYPEAELSSDDEFDEPGAAYRARARNNASEEEYDLANNVYSDDDSYGFSSGEEAKDNWRSQPARKVIRQPERMAYGGDDSA